MKSVESEKYLIMAGDAPTHRDIDAEVFFLRGEGSIPSSKLLAEACQNASRKEKIKVTSKPQIAEELVQLGVDERIAKKMAEGLEIGSAVSLITGFYNGPFVAIVDRPELPESLQLPYRINWTSWRTKRP